MAGLNVLDTMRHMSLANVHSCWVSILFFYTTESRRVRGGGMGEYGGKIIKDFLTEDPLDRSMR